MRMHCDDFDVPCRTFVPGEADPPLIVDADTVLPASIAVQEFKAVAVLVDIVILHEVRDSDLMPRAA